MSETTFAVVFTGQLVEGADTDQVKANFARLFKVEAAKVEPMFGGKPVTIKKGLDEATARKYQQALLQAGGVCQVVNLAAPQPSAQPAAQAATSGGEAPAVSALNATLAEPGVILIEPEQVAAAQIETSHLSMGEVGATLVEPEAVAELQVDVSALTMAEAGVQLIPPSNVEAPPIDVSRLSLAEPGTVLQEPEEVEAPPIDTSGISLE